LWFAKGLKKRNDFSQTEGQVRKEKEGRKLPTLIHKKHGVPRGKAKKEEWKLDPQKNLRSSGNRIEGGKEPEVGLYWDIGEKKRNGRTKGVEKKAGGRGG